MFHCDFVYRLDSSIEFIVYDYSIHLLCPSRQICGSVIPVVHVRFSFHRPLIYPELPLQFVKLDWTDSAEKFLLITNLDSGNKAIFF